MTCPVSLFVMVTFAPGTTAPLGSVTVPTILPVEIVVWANVKDAKLTVATMASITTQTRASSRQFDWGIRIVCLSLSASFELRQFVRNSHLISSVSRQIYTTSTHNTPAI